MSSIETVASAEKTYDVATLNESSHTLLISLLSSPSVIERQIRMAPHCSTVLVLHLAPLSHLFRAASPAAYYILMIANS
jgi:hypothetical protein